MQIKESETVETKRSTAQLKESLKSISAILNKHQKGILYFGIGPDGKPVKNILSEKTLRAISQSISNNVEPKIYPSITIEKYNNVDIVKVSFEGNQIPYSAEGKYYIRVADEDKQMSAEELKRIILQNQDQRWDSTPHHYAGLRDIDAKEVREFCKKAGIKFSNTTDILETLNLYKDKKLLNTAIILFAKNPIKFFPNSFLTCAVFASDTTSTIIDQKKFEGGLFFLMEEAEKYILQNIHIGMTIAGLYRNDIPELNLEALREAIINAFLHRDYYDPDFVSISIFKDRVEIKNPGNLFGGLTITDITSRNISKRRNEVIADIFNRAHLGERKGRGIALILEKEPETKFEQLAGIFITTFKRKISLSPQLSEGINEGLKSILEYISENPGLNAITLSEKLQIPLSTIERKLKVLKNKNYIIFRGAKKTGGYFIK